MVKRVVIENGILDTKSIRKDEITELRNILRETPYFTTAQLLLVKGLHNTNSFLYNKELKKSAAYSGNRKKLFELITKNIVKVVKTTSKKSASVKDLEIGKPLDFTENELYSFSEWLSLTKIRKINRTTNPSIRNNDSLVDDFIKTKSTLLKEKKEKSFFSSSEVAKKSIIENEELVTETLAKVYLEQGHYKQAISAYEKLSLKYPKKNIFFAKKIKLINKLKEK